MPRLYKSRVVYRVCHITPRKLDYWITTGVIDPSQEYHPKADRRVQFLFSLEDMAKVRLVQSLRERGVSLQEIRQSLEEIRKEKGQAWQAAWLVTDGREVFFAENDGRVIKSLSKRERGQLVISMIALKEAMELVDEEAQKYLPFDVDGIKRRRGGTVQSYAR